jgi:O-antigen ligase
LTKGGKAARGTLLVLIIATGVGGAGIYGLAQPIIRSRMDDTREQLSQIRVAKTLDARVRLYRDTWAMARARKWLGWGLGGYSRVFVLYSTQQAVDRLPQFYEDAHSDWLQNLAEVGIVGSVLHALLLVLPLRRSLRGISRDPLAMYLFLGCAILLCYALAEFPFGNPAVTACFWLCFFCAIRLTQLNEREVPV